MGDFRLVAISHFLDGFGLDMDAEYRELVERAADGYVNNEELFVLLQDKRVQWVLEQRLNTAYPESRLAERADSFIQFLRERLGVSEDVPDAWVVKSFGFNLVTGERKPGIMVLDPRIKANLGKSFLNNISKIN